MNCSREDEVMSAIEAGRWPDGCVELRAHVSACGECADLVLVATSIRDDQKTAMRQAQVPSSAVMWWRTQRRLREETVRTATRAVTAVQMLSVLGAGAVAFAMIGAMSIDWQMALIQAQNAIDLQAWAIPLTAASLMALTMAPVALYLALAKE